MSRTLTEILFFIFLSLGMGFIIVNGCIVYMIPTLLGCLVFHVFFVKRICELLFSKKNVDDDERFFSEKYNKEFAPILKDYKKSHNLKDILSKESMMQIFCRCFFQGSEKYHIADDNTVKGTKFVSSSWEWDNFLNADIFYRSKLIRDNSISGCRDIFKFKDDYCKYEIVSVELRNNAGFVDNYPYAVLLKIDPYKNFSSRTYVVEENDNDFIPPEGLSLIKEDKVLDLSSYDWNSYKLYTDNVEDMRDYICEYDLTPCMMEIKELFSTSQLRFSIFEGKILLVLPVIFDPFTLEKSVGKRYYRVDKEYGIFCRIFDEINALARLGDDKYGYELFRTFHNAEEDKFKDYNEQQNRSTEVKMNYPLNFRDTESFLKIKNNSEDERFKPVNNLTNVGNDFGRKFKVKVITAILVGCLFWVFVRYTDSYKDLINQVYPYFIHISVVIGVLSYIWGINIFIKNTQLTPHKK